MTWVDETVPGVLLLDVPGYTDLVGHESGPDELEALNRIRHDGGIASDAKQQTAPA